MILIRRQQCLLSTSMIESADCIRKTRSRSFFTEILWKLFFIFRKMCTIVHIEGGLKMSVFTGKKRKEGYDLNLDKSHSFKPVVKRIYVTLPPRLESA